MAGAESFSAGNEAFVDEEYKVAKEKYTQAIQLEVENPAYYLKRAICNAKLNDYAGSATDAEMSIKFDDKNPKAHLRLGTLFREFIINKFVQSELAVIQFTQSIARFNLKDFENAKQSFEVALSFDENAEATEWINKCNAEIGSKKDLEVTKEESKVTSTADISATEKKTEEQPKLPPPMKHDWYQTETHIVLSILMKNCKKEDVTVEFGNQNVDITIKLSRDKDCTWDLELAHPILPNESIFRVLSTKVEIKMKKTGACRWASLENKNEQAFATLEDKEAVSGDSEVRHYPSSSKKYHDWDKLATKIEKDESEEKKEGDAALNELFQKIYKNADEDTRRAMNKSFQESGGTVLSTNWKDIGSKKVECKPPDGMEYKKYEY